jgi:putative molybdopterin biosynthesis protein
VKPQTLADARASLLAAARPLEAHELVAAEEALGRITAEPLYARSCVPHYSGAAMDGIALRSSNSVAASPDDPLELVQIGERGERDAQHPFSFVDTGNALPAWADAVVMIERVVRVPAPEGTPQASPARVRIAAPAPPWQHVRLVGEDVVAGEVLLPRGHRVRPYDVAALLAAGIDRVPVRPRPVIAILPTGDELIEPGETLRPGRIVEFNSRMVAAFIREAGGEPLRLAPVGDNLEAIQSRLHAAARAADVVCVIAGSSAGEHDFTVEALRGLGEILAHGIDVMPGRPAIAARLAQGRGSAELRASVALGIPGYPVSAAVICRELLEPLLAHLLGTAAERLPTVRATLPRGLASRLGQEEIVRVALGSIGGRRIARPLPRGAGAITTMARADGFVRLSPETASVAAGEEVDVELLRPMGEALGTILIAGAQDPALGVLEDALRASSPRHRLAVESLEEEAALLALERGEAHAAAVTLPVGEGGTTAVEELLASGGFALEPLATRAVGLIVAAGNPLGLRGAEDLTRPGVRPVPELMRGGVRLVPPAALRPGEGARRRAGVAAAKNASRADAGDAPEAASAAVREGPGAAPAPEERQQLSAAAIAAAVQSGLADVGVGVEPAAAALGIDFVPLRREDLALVLRPDFLGSDAGRALLEAARSADFAAAVKLLPGYAPTLRPVAAKSS